MFSFLLRVPCFALLLALSLALPARAQALRCPKSAGQIQLKLQAEPTAKGLQGLNHWKMGGELQSQWPLAVLNSLLTLSHSQAQAELTLGPLAFDPLTGHYQLGVRAERWPLWDQFQLQIHSPQANQIVFSLRDNWFPSAEILNRLQNALQEKLAPLGLQMNQQDHQLAVQWPVQNLRLQLPAKQAITMNRAKVQFKIQPNGSLNLTIKALATSPQLESDLQICISPAKTLQGSLKLRSSLEVLPQDLEQIQIGQEKLSDRFQASGLIELALESQWKGVLPLKWEAKGHTHVSLPQFQVEGHTYEKIHSVPFSWHYRSPFAFEIWPELPSSGEYSPQTQANQLALLIDGPAYLAEMKRVIRSAKVSVDQEIFVFYEGQTTRELARLYLLKAMGLQDQQGKLQPDPHAPQGIRVALLHNHELSQRGADKVAAIFSKLKADLHEQLSQSPHLPHSPSHYLQRLAQHFEISPLKRGIAKSDHRKLLIIDGQVAYTGGLNLADLYLTEDSFHDLMIRVQGPAVAHMHQLFKENWQDLHPGQAWPEALPQPIQDQLQGPLSEVEVLTTDDHSRQIEAALLHLIGKAQDTLRLEHAYIYHEPVEKALRQALERGVKLELIVSERNDESVFEVLNPAALLKLHQAGRPGQVKTWLYQGHGGEYDYMAHTKFMSADGQFALVGSANLVPRSLNSPFHMGDQALLFNEELSLYIADPRFVQQLDQQLFEKDKTERCRAVSADDLEKLLQLRGGPQQLMLEKLKGLLS